MDRAGPTPAAPHGRPTAPRGRSGWRAPRLAGSMPCGRRGGVSRGGVRVRVGVGLGSGISCRGGGACGGGDLFGEGGEKLRRPARMQTKVMVS